MTTHYALAILESCFPLFNIKGQIRFTQKERERCKIQMFVNGIDVGKKHGVHIHEYGNHTTMASIGEHYNPENMSHGDHLYGISHVGDLGNIHCPYGTDTAFKEIEDHRIRLYGPTNNIIGRTIVITSVEDDLGFGGKPKSRTTGNSGCPVAWGIIAVSDVF